MQLTQGNQLFIKKCVESHLLEADDYLQPFFVEVYRRRGVPDLLVVEKVK